MKAINMILIILFSTVMFSSCSKGQNPALSLRAAGNKVYIPVSEFTNTKLSDNQMKMYDINGNVHEKYPVDLNGDGSCDSYADAAGSNWFIVIPHNLGYDVYMNRNSYKTYNVAGTMCICVATTGYLETEKYTNVNRKANPNQTATEFCWVLGTPLHN